MEAMIRQPLIEAYQIAEKGGRRERLEEIQQLTFKEFGTEDEASQNLMKVAFNEIDRKVARRLILERNRRIDGRGFVEIVRSMRSRDSSSNRWIRAFYAG